MPRLLLLLLLGGCVSTHNPQPADTKFNEAQRDWIAVFEHEVRVAIENGDADAYHFFMQELLAEKIRIWRKKNNPPADETR